MNHTSHTSFPCTYPNCVKIFSQKCRLKIHIRTHEGLKPFRCTNTECKKSFNEIGNLKAHIMRTHDQDKNYICYDSNCKESYKTSVLLKTHLKKHDLFRKGFKCCYCEVEYTRYCTLRNHLKVHENEERLQIANDILKEDKSKKHLVKNQKEENSNERPTNNLKCNNISNKKIILFKTYKTDNVFLDLKKQLSELEIGIFSFIEGINKDNNQFVSNMTLIKERFCQLLTEDSLSYIS